MQWVFRALTDVLLRTPLNIASRIKTEKVDPGQADRIILNLDDSGVTIEAMRKQLLDWPIQGLKEVIAIKDGKVILLYP